MGINVELLKLFRFGPQPYFVALGAGVARCSDNTCINKAKQRNSTLNSKVVLLLNAIVTVNQTYVVGTLPCLSRLLLYKLYLPNYDILRRIQSRQSFFYFMFRLDKLWHNGSYFGLFSKRDANSIAKTGRSFSNFCILVGSDSMCIVRNSDDKLSATVFYVFLITFVLYFCMHLC